MHGWCMHCYSGHDSAVGLKICCRQLRGQVSGLVHGTAISSAADGSRGSRVGRSVWEGLISNDPGQGIAGWRYAQRVSGCA
jgi:hypothetical protein